ncbi:hypothetical protein BaRGS_00007370, partial [Batillaria attramentaria]
PTGHPPTTDELYGQRAAVRTSSTGSFWRRLTERATSAATRLLLLPNWARVWRRLPETESARAAWSVLSAAAIANSARSVNGTHGTACTAGQQGAGKHQQEVLQLVLASLTSARRCPRRVTVRGSKIDECTRGQVLKESVPRLIKQPKVEDEWSEGFTQLIIPKDVM